MKQKKNARPIGLGSGLSSLLGAEIEKKTDNFKMIPKNQDEADMIRKIIFAFKANMLPEFAGGNRAGRRLIVPNTFDIQYMYVGKTNEYLHNISTCVLQDMSVSYGGDRYKYC